MSGFFTETDKIFSPEPDTGEGFSVVEEEPSYQKVPAFPVISGSLQLSLNLIVLPVA